MDQIDLEPMPIHRAVEVMKILEPYAEVMTGHGILGDSIKAFLRKAQEYNPIDTLRVVALMQGMDISEVAERFEKASGGDVVVALAEGFAVNHLPDLMNASYNLGISSTGWDHG